MKEYIDLYYPSVFAAISRLTRLPDRQDMDAITRNVLADLWRQKEVFETESRKGVFVYKTMLYHIFSFLKEKGDKERISFLKKILPTNPDQYIKK